MNTNPKYSEERGNELVQKIRDAAGELGAMTDELEDVADAENYDFQVRTGLAMAITEILEWNPIDATVWFGYCLISCGVNIDDRVQCLIDSLCREIESAPDPED